MSAAPPKLPPPLTPSSPSGRGAGQAPATETPPPVPSGDTVPAAAKEKSAPHEAAVEKRTATGAKPAGEALPRASDVYSSTLAALRARSAAGAPARPAAGGEPPAGAPAAAKPAPAAGAATPAGAAVAADAGEKQAGDAPNEKAPPATPKTNPAAAPPARRTFTAILGWVVAAIVAGGGLTAWLTSRAELESARAAQADTLVTVGTLRAENQSLESRIAELDAARKQLEEEARAKAEALAAMEKTQNELQQRLQAEVEKGNVLISQQHGELVVDLLDKVVFDSGEAELNERGKAVLFLVGETLAAVPDKIIQVSGHTDSWPITGKLAERFPTNWELSTARATEVVRYLQDVVKIPGNRLVAAGLAEFRPIARNTTAAGRSRNRRIEVRLLPMPGPAAKSVARK